MKKSIKITLIVLCVILAAGGTAAAYSAVRSSRERQAGDFYRAAAENGSDRVAATYKGQEILWSAVEYNQNMNIMRDEETAKTYASDRDAVNRIIENMILLEEAEAQGLAATPEEIEDMVASVREAYAIPEGKEMLDEYCQGAGITVEEYFDLIREQAPGTIARQKLKDAVGEEYCREHGLEFTKINPPEGMLEAEEAYIAGLFASHQKDIVYYID